MAPKAFAISGGQAQRSFTELEAKKFFKANVQFQSNSLPVVCVFTRWASYARLVMTITDNILQTDVCVVGAFFCFRTFSLTQLNLDVGFVLLLIEQRLRIHTVQ